MSTCLGGIIIGSQDMMRGAAVRINGVSCYLDNHQAEKKGTEENQLDG